MRVKNALFVEKSSPRDGFSLTGPDFTDNETTYLVSNSASTEHLLSSSWAELTEKIKFQSYIASEA